MASDWRDALGALLPDDYQPEQQAADPNAEAAPMPALEIWLDRKRAGKTATIITGFDPDDDRAARLAATLKSRLATGGSCRGGEILIQGDRTAQLLTLLPSLGYKARRR